MNQPRTSFDGFVRSNTTPIPDGLFDELLSILSGAELKVLLYIMRRTWGFKKDSDAIALSQFEHGITTRDGRVLDRGCGLHRETICKALKSLEKLGCIKGEKQVSAHGDKDITVYKIRFRGESEVVEKSDHPEKSGLIGSRKKRPQVVGLTDQGGRKKSMKVVGKSDLQETVQETGKQETERETLTPPSPAPVESSLSPSSQTSFQEKQIQVVHPLHRFLLLDDAIAPTTLTILLTSKECESELEDDRRMRIAEGVQWDLEARGHIVRGITMREGEQELSYSTNLSERLTNEQADFWQRWRALSGCSDDALTEKALPDVAWLAERITTTADLASLYQSNNVMLLALCEKRGTTFSPPHLKNLIKHYSTWKTAQNIKQKRAERTNQKTVSGTGTIQNWTLARLSGKLDAPPVVYPDVEKPTKPTSATESMGIKRELAAMLEGLRC